MPVVMLPNRKKLEQNSIKVVQETPLKYTSLLTPVNVVAEKERFLQHGIAPAFVLRASPNQMNKLASKPGWTVRHDLLELASGVLQKVCEKYGCGDEFIESNYGAPIDHVRASKILTKYLQEQGVDGQISILWSQDLDCSARITWHGPNIRYNKPEARRHTLVIKNSNDNIYLREQGIVCLANHEIGTHYIRSLNDGLQPWFSDRKKFGLRGYGSRDTMITEEGLAALNTVVMANTKFLFAPALLYYTACKSTTMTFQELFDHLHRYVRCPEQRWKRVMRVKRSLEDPRGVGGNGFDQCYFQGAVDILRRLDDIDLSVLYSGCIGTDEVPRVHRLARTDCIKLPLFMADIEKYKRQLRQIGILNGILPKQQYHPHSSVRSSRLPYDTARSLTIARPPSEGAVRRPRTTVNLLQRLSSVSPSPVELSGASSRMSDIVREGEPSTGMQPSPAVLSDRDNSLETEEAFAIACPDADCEHPLQLASDQRCDSAPVRLHKRHETEPADSDEATSACCYPALNSDALTQFHSLLQRVSSQISSFVYSAAPSRDAGQQPSGATAKRSEAGREKDVGAFYVQTLPPRRSGTDFCKH